MKISVKTLLQVASHISSYGEIDWHVDIDDVYKISSSETLWCVKQQP